jgi:hypothetical protein
MEDRERRELLVIEENLVAEAPELAELFDGLEAARRSGWGRRAIGWLAVALLLLGAVLGEASLLLGALVLAGMAASRWSVDALIRRRR